MSVRLWMCALVVGAGLMVAGCGEATPTPEGSPTASAGALEWRDPAPAKAAGKVGPGTACPGSFAFDVADKWKLAGDFPEQLFAVGTFDVVCELDAKPAGVLGIMRVFASTEATDDLKKELEAFIGEYDSKVTDPKFRDVTVGGATAVEVSYGTPEHMARAFALKRATTTFVVQWGGVDDDEHTAGLPGYVLARTSA
jgi:hypothetical protein